MHSAMLCVTRRGAMPLEEWFKMPKGGHSRSGPPPDPNSARSDARGINFNALPAEGYMGEAPAFPLTSMRIMRWEFEDKRRFQVFDAEATEAFAEREAELWGQVWSYPQALAWSREPWRWNAVAMWVRTFVVCEGSDATAADKGSLHRFADDIGITPSGLRMNGWAIAHDEVTPKRESKPAPKRERRLRAVDAQH